MCREIYRDREGMLKSWVVRDDAENEIRIERDEKKIGQEKQKKQLNGRIT